MIILFSQPFPPLPLFSLIYSFLHFPMLLSLSLPPLPSFITPFPSHFLPPQCLHQWGLDKYKIPPLELFSFRSDTWLSPTNSALPPDSHSHSLTSAKLLPSGSSLTLSPFLPLFFSPSSHSFFHQLAFCIASPLYLISSSFSPPFAFAGTLPSICSISSHFLMSLALLSLSLYLTSPLPRLHRICLAIYLAHPFTFIPFLFT